MVRFYVRGTGYDLVPLCDFKFLKSIVTIFHSFFPQIRWFSVFGGDYRAAIPYIYEIYYFACLEFFGQKF